MRSTVAIALALTAAGSVAGASRALAAIETLPKEVNLVIHKKNATNFDDTFQNNGAVQTAGIGALPGVQGVIFTAYDITQIYYERMAAATNDAEEKAIASELEKDIVGIVDTDNLTGTVLTATDDNGNTNQSLLTKSSYMPEGATAPQTVNAVYAIVETGYEGGAANPLYGSVPMIVGMDKQYVQTDGSLNLYPKNYGVDKKITEVNGEDVDIGESEVTTYDVGDVLTYEVQFAIPHDIAAKRANGDYVYTNLVLSDAMNAIGGSFSGIQSVTVAGDSSNYKDLLAAPYGEFTSETDKEKAASWLMDFQLNLGKEETFAKLDEFAGKTLTVKYNVTINENLVHDTLVNNEFGVTLDRDGVTSSAKDPGSEVTTGAQEFLKHDSRSEDTVLEGAEFVLMRGGKYAQFVGGETDQPWVNATDINWLTETEYNDVTDKSSVTIISDGDGKIRLEGLAYGDYILRETKAPENYEIVNADTDFEVKETGKGLTINLGKIANIKNTPGSLPLTGGIGIITLLVIGGTMMGVSQMKKKED